MTLPWVKLFSTHMQTLFKLKECFIQLLFVTETKMNVGGLVINLTKQGFWFEFQLHNLVFQTFDHLYGSGDMLIRNIQ